MSYAQLYLTAFRWFPGKAGGHAHPAVLSGIKSQGLSKSQVGTGAFSQLVFDDTAGRARIALQQHATPYEGDTELNLGHLRHQTDNQVRDPVGIGAELKTARALAVRAGQGMLLSTDQTSVASVQLDSTPAMSQIQQSLQQAAELAETSLKHNARIGAEGKPDDLAALRDMQRSLDALGSTTGGASPDGAGGAGSTSAYGQAHLQLSAPSGLAALTPRSALLGAGKSTTIAAGHDINLVSQANWFNTMVNGICLFTYGKVPAERGPVMQTGIRLHAASGKLSSQSQSGPTRLTADKAVTVSSVTKLVNVCAAKHVLMAAQGAYLKIQGGNIMLHGPGTMTFKASMKELAGPARTEPVRLSFPSSIIHFKPKKGYAFSR